MDLNEQLKSVEGNSEITVTFTNKSSCNVVMVWINYQGEPVKYSKLGPGACYTQKTYMTHPWIAVELDSGFYMLMLLDNLTVFYPEVSDDCNVHITEPQGIIKKCLDPKYHGVVNC
jgi:hypothetical protein